MNIFLCDPGRGELKWQNFFKGPNERPISQGCSGLADSAQPSRQNSLEAASSELLPPGEQQPGVSQSGGLPHVPDILLSVLCAGGSATFVSFALMEGFRSFPSYLIPACHWFVIWKWNHRPGWGPGLVLPPLLPFSVCTCLLTDKVKRTLLHFVNNPASPWDLFKWLIRKVNVVHEGLKQEIFGIYLSICYLKARSWFLQMYTARGKKGWKSPMCILYSL